MKNSANQIEIIELLVNENINNTDATYTMPKENYAIETKIIQQKWKIIQVEEIRYCCNVWHAIYIYGKAMEFAFWLNHIHVISPSSWRPTKSKESITIRLNEVETADGLIKITFLNGVGFSQTNSIIH